MANLKLTRIRKTLGGLLAIAMGAAVQQAHAAITLTPAGVAQNLVLSTFATGFPSVSTVGPLGIAFRGGTVLVTDYSGNVRVFPTDTDGQTAAAAPVGQNYGQGNSEGLATVGTNIYMAQQTAGDVVQLNSNGTFNQLIVSGTPLASALVTNPLNGHLFVGTLNSNSIYDVDPIAKTKTLFVNAIADGLAISPSGGTLYVDVGGTHIVGYNTVTALQTFDSGTIPGGPDGIVVGTGSLAGTLLVNTNSGTIVEVNLTSLAQTVIANGGSRGDFASADPNGTMLFTQSDSVVRIASAVPLPSGVIGGGITLALLGAGFAFRRIRTMAIS